MCIRTVGALVLAATLSAAVCGCRKSAESTDRPVAKPPPRPAPETLARVHWVGKGRLEQDPRATNILSVWAMPESAKLQEETLAKLASAPWRFAGTTSGDADAVSASLKPLLNDLVECETWFELRQASNSPPEAALAVKLSPERAAFWETNLAETFSALTGGRSVTNSNGWTMTNSAGPRVIGFARDREWTLVGLSSEPCSIIPDLLSNISSGAVSFEAHATNAWLELEADPPRAAHALGLVGVPPQLPRVSLAFAPQGEVMRTVGEFRFHSLLSLQLDPWEVPTNLIHQPLVAFSALRGVGPLISASALWKRTEAGTPPNQAFLWSIHGLPFLSYFIAPLRDPSNTVFGFSQYMLREVKPLMETNVMGTLDLSTNPLSLGWVNLPMISPFISYTETNGTGYALSGVLPAVPVREPFPPELLNELERHTNAVWYDWELTGERLEAALNIGQLLRFALRKPQLDVDSTPMRLLKALGAKLGNCATVVTQASPDRLSLLRKSGIGLSALELHFLADWLQSPDFPMGLHTTRAADPVLKKPDLPGKKAGAGPAATTGESNETPPK